MDVDGVLKQLQAEDDGTVALEDLKAVLQKISPGGWTNGTFEQLVASLGVDARGRVNVARLFGAALDGAPQRQAPPMDVPSAFTAAQLQRIATTMPNASERHASQGVADWREQLRLGANVSVWVQPGEKGTWELGTVTSMAVSRAGLGVAVCPPEGGRWASGERRWEGRHSSPDLQPTMRNRGITGGHLRAFAEACQRRIAEEDILDPREFLDFERTSRNPNHGKRLDFDLAPTWLVVELFVKPKTRERRVPFVDLLAEEFPHLGGPRTATHFASHSWASYFVDLLQACLDFPDDASFWICCFAMTQDSERLELVDNDEVFAETLRAEETCHVLVCDSRMLALTRMWVLFELLRSFELGKHLVLKPLNALTMMSAGVQCSIQMSKAGCSRAHDQEYIQKEMDKVGGVKVLNKKVREGLVRGMERGIALRRESRDLEGVARLLFHLGSILIEHGNFSQAQANIQGALDLAKQLKATFRPNTIQPLEVVEWQMTLGKALSAAGDFSLAEDAIRQAADEENKQLAKQQIDKLLQLATVLRRSGDFRGAFGELKKAAQMPHARADEVAEIHLQLGQVASHFRWRHVDAEEEFRQAVTRLQEHEHFGGDHPKTALAVYNLAHALRRQHRVFAGEAEYNKVLHIQLQHMDAQHLQVANTRMNLGITYGHQGRYGEARRELEAVLQLHQTHRPGHPKIGIALVSLGDVLRFQGDLDAAVAKYQAAMDLYRSSEEFGEHNEIAWTLTCWAAALLELGKIEDARAKFEEAAEINSKVFGKQHVAVAGGLAYLATCARLLGDFKAAAQHGQSAAALFAAAECCPEGGAWAAKQLELCGRRSQALLPCPADALALSRPQQDEAAEPDWPLLFDRLCASLDAAGQAPGATPWSALRAVRAERGGL